MSTSSLSETASTDEASDRRLRRTQWTVLLATMFSYLIFYTGRQTFGFAAAPGAGDVPVRAAGVFAAGMGLRHGVALGPYLILSAETDRRRPRSVPR
ncbi:MAG TPA: hypothetical protein VFE65_27910 [Pseudonocardia sp.]|jgi:sugar phosphate permease|nr:hypothetical protein [Pseudonocardia sp.]